LIRSLLLVALLGLPGLAYGGTSARDVEACVARNLPDESGALDFAVRVRDREGGSTRSAARLLWRRPEGGLSRIVLRITEPEKTRGTSVLLVERADADPEIFVRLPELEGVKRVSKGRLRGSLFGTDFSYEDFERLQGLAPRTVIELQEDFRVDGRAVWVLEARPDPDARSEYSRVISYVDQEYCLPLRMEFVDRHGKLRKLLSTDAAEIRAEGSRFVPAGFLMRDLRDRTETEVSLRRVEMDPGLSEQQFTEQALLRDAR
jgi:hypothetical protein